METIYYIPREPESVPLIDEEKKIVSVMFDGEMVDMPLPLFKKLFVKQDEQEKREFSMVENTRTMVNQIKSMGLGKEDFYKIMDENLDDRGLSSMKSEVKDLIERLW